jgi:outer membrane scaffolding protein for murein synthesis (MipA/OmpV family)
MLTRIGSSLRARVSRFAIIALAFAPPSFAAELPLWELGAGAALVDFPDYRGSDERQTYVLPIPYVVYRGEVLKVERQKVRGLLFKTDLAELDFSLGGSVPVDSDDNDARSGMPDLDPAIELGPSLNFFLYRNERQTISVEFRLPVRAVESVDFSEGIDHRGWLFHPHINLDVRNVFPGPGWNLGLLAGPIFATSRYHEYFYGVDPQFARPGRAAYDADGGYSGVQLIAALSKRFPNYWFGAFVKADSLNGATFEDSPLVKKEQSFAGGIAIAWVFAKSKKTVDAEE